MKIILSFLVLGLVFLTSQFKDPSRNISSLSSASLEEVSSKNAIVNEWYEGKSNSLRDWMTKRGEPGGPAGYIDFYLPTHAKRTNASREGMEIAKATKSLYDEYFPPTDPSSYVGTFFESGHPYIETKRGPYQWDSIAASGMDDLKLFEKVVNNLVKRGIKSMRIGPNLHEAKIGSTESWKKFVDQIEIIWRAGATPTISVAFFPSLKRWQVLDSQGKIDYPKSYLLHKNFPEDMGKLAADMMQALNQRSKLVEASLGRKVNIVINGINEPETLAGFNRHFWHGAFANWSDPEMMRYYVPSVIQIGKANVSIRSAIEANSNGKRILFMHNEAMTPDYYPSHHGGGRFAVSKFMLGDKKILNAIDEINNSTIEELKLKKSDLPTELAWAVDEFIFGKWNDNQEKMNNAKRTLSDALTSLKDSHESFEGRFKKTMKTDMMLHLDYYYQTEFIPNKSIPDLLSEIVESNGEKLKEILGLHDDEAFLAYLKEAASINQGDLPPEGPKGAVISFPYTKVSEIPFASLLSQNDFVMLERLIGLRREYNFNDREPFATRQKKLGLRPLESQLYRADEAFNMLVSSPLEILNVSQEDFDSMILDSIKRTNTKVSSKASLKTILDANGRAVFHDLIGINRNMLIGFEPQHYPRQIRAGIRFGFYDFFMDYVKELGIYTAGVGESGTPFYVFAPLLHDQVMMEYARALKNGVYGTQYSFGPAVHTRGWAKAPLGLHYLDDHEVNPSGILDIEALDEKKDSRWIGNFLNPLFEKLSEARTSSRAQ